MEEILQLISAGGDIAIMGFLYAYWKLDRRVFKLEMESNNYVRKNS